MDVLEIVLVALVADRAETLLHHHFGEAQNGLQGSADFVADLGEKVGLRRARGLGGVACSGEPPLGLALAGEIAHESAKIRGLVRADPSQRQRQRNRTAAAIAPDCLQRSKGRFGFSGAAQGFEPCGCLRVTLRREQHQDALARDLVLVVAE